MSIGVKFENVVESLLESQGYRVLERRVKIKSKDVEVGEVDLVAVDDGGVLWAVEAKSGKVDVSGIRQAYVNSKLLNARPMVICRGFADDSAKELAERLGVKVLEIPDYVFLSVDELEHIVYTSILKAVDSIIFALDKAVELPEDLIDALAECQSYACFCERVNGCEDVVARVAKEMGVRRFYAMHVIARIAKYLRGLRKQH